MSNNIENLYKKGSNESTPASIDNLILNAAKNSCEIENVHKPKKWLYALPIAAVMVMSFSVILNLQNQNQDMMVAPEYQNTVIKQNDEPENIVKKKLRSKTNKPPQKPPVIEKPQRVVAKKELRERKAVRTVPKKDRLDIPKIPEQTVFPKPVAAMPAPQVIGQSFGQDLATEVTSPEIVNDSIEQTRAELAAAPQLMKQNDSATNGMMYDEQDDNVELDRVIVTGSRIRSIDNDSHNQVFLDSLNEQELETLNSDIKRLETLIRQSRFKKAQRFLHKLEKKYPKYDFSSYKIYIK